MTSSELRYKLTKEERLSSVSQIENLFQESRSFVIFPFKVLYRIPSSSPSDPSQNPNRILITIPKRLFKKATDRNYLKRAIREIYRQNKQAIAPAGINFAVIYIGKEKFAFNSIKNKLILALQRLNKEVEEN